ncbi:hypothetical protein ACH4ND_23870 [Streptomyces sp. NPDC017179]|uniref:hypothetical protein n=1 Tax=Streptomyces sp. NPDC017179 TaxID=3364979 RepID=UPI003799B6B6
MKKLLTAFAAAVMGVTMFGGNAHAVDVTPFSARNCTGNAGSTNGAGSVCIEVNGTGLKVDSFYLTKKSNNRAWTDYAVIEFSDKSGGYMSATVSARRVETKKVGTTWGFSHADGVKLCGYWHNFPGTKACATIHK